MKKDSRWIKSVIAAAAETQPMMPWQRDPRSAAEAQKTASAKPSAIAAR